VLAVRQNRFTLEQTKWPLRPEDSASQAIGNIDSAVSIQSHYMCFCDVESGVMRRNDRVVCSSILELLSVLRSARNDGVRIETAATHRHIQRRNNVFRQRARRRESELRYRFVSSCFRLAFCRSQCNEGDKGHQNEEEKQRPMEKRRLPIRVSRIPLHSPMSPSPSETPSHRSPPFYTAIMLPAVGLFRMRALFCS